MQPPFGRALGSVEGVAEEPEAGAGVVFDAVVVAHVGGNGLARGAAPPLLGNALRTLGVADSVEAPAPAEALRGIVGNGRDDGLERLGAGEEAHRARAILRPGLALGGRERRTTDDGALRDVAGPGFGAPDPGLPQTVGEAVDQRRDAVLAGDLADGVQADLPLRQGLDTISRNSDCLDAEARIDALQHRREEARNGGRASAGERKADGKPLGASVEPVEGELEAARAPPFGKQPHAELLRNVAGGARQVLRRADRLGEGEAREPGRGRPLEDQRLLGAGQGLVEAREHRRPKPAGELAARYGLQLTYVGETEADQLGGGLRLQAQAR